jgi:MFS family permease
MMFALIGLDIVLRLLIIEKHRAAPWKDEAMETSQQTDEVDDQYPAAAVERASAMFKSAPASPKRKLPVMLVLLKSRRLEAASVGTFVVSATMTAFDSTLPLFVQRVFGWDALGAGLIFIALLLPHLAGPFIGHCVDKYGPRWIATAGLILLLPFWILLRLVDHNSMRQKILLSGLLCGIGVAGALTICSLMAEFSKVCDSKEKQDPTLFGGKSAYGTSYGLFNIAWAAGALVGPLMAAALERDDGWKTMTLVFGVLSAACAIPVVLFSGGLITRRRPSETAGHDVTMQEAGGFKSG